jgi:hypothetical protein
LESIDLPVVAAHEQLGVPVGVFGEGRRLNEDSVGLVDHRDDMSLGWAERHWKRWYFWATHSRLTPVIDTARLIHRHLPNVMTFFAHRITNAVSEGLNSKIQTIKKMAYGFRNREHFKTAIYFHCGGLDLYPATHGIPG